MFVGEKIIYLQLQKTACTHIAALLSAHIDGVQVGKHNRLKDFDGEKLIVGSIRNPWDWYVSLWAFGCSHSGGIYTRTVNRNLDKGMKYLQSRVERAPEKKRKFQYLSNRDILRFNLNELTKPVRKWESVYSDVTAKQNFKTWLFQILDPKRGWDHGDEFAMSSISKFAGLFTYRYIRLFSKDFMTRGNFKGISSLSALKNFDDENNILDYIIRTESLENDLIKTLTSAGYQLDEDSKASIIKGAEHRLNSSKHEEYSYYHDDETIELIAEKEKFIVEKYSYVF